MEVPTFETGVKDHAWHAWVACGADFQAELIGRGNLLLFNICQRDANMD